MSATRTVTLTTMDHGPVTFECPAWCIGHAWQPDGQIGRNDIAHNSVRVKAGTETDSRDWMHLLEARITWAPFAELVPTVFLRMDVAEQLAAEEIPAFNRGLQTVIRRLDQMATEAIRLRGEVL